MQAPLNNFFDLATTNFGERDIKRCATVKLRVRIHQELCCCFTVREHRECKCVQTRKTFCGFAYLQVKSINPLICCTRDNLVAQLHAEVCAVVWRWETRAGALGGTFGRCGMVRVYVDTP